MKRWHVFLAVVAILVITAYLAMILGGKTLFRRSATPAAAVVQT